MDPVLHQTQPFERVSELTSDEAISELSQSHAYPEDLREKYGFHNAVFAVEKVDVKKGGFLKPPFITVTGHVVYGTFYSLDDISVGLNARRLPGIQPVEKVWRKLGFFDRLRLTAR